jgi:hypothetical protein
MVITETNQSCGYFHEDNFATFCSPICLLTEYEYVRKEKTGVKNLIYFTDYESRQFIRSDSTYFLVTNSLPTVMNSGVLTFQSEERAQSLMKKSDEFVTNWKKYQLLAGKPDKIIKVKLNNDSMDPNVFVIKKNHFIQLDIKNMDQLNGKSLIIKGYEEMGTFRFMKEESYLSVKLIADKPGSGFPIILEGIQQPVGMIKVEGAHTLDEEVM